MGKITNIILVLSNLLGAIFCGISAYFGAAIYYGWKPTGNTPSVFGTIGPGVAGTIGPSVVGTIGTGVSSMNPYWPLIIFGGLGIALLVSTWVLGPKIGGESKAITIPALSGQVLPPTPILAKPKKFYSERNKSDLADALTDLSEIFNKDGHNIMQKAQQIIEEWRPPGIQDKIRGKKPPDISTSIDQLNEMSNLAANLYRDLFEDNGFIKKYQAYSDELCQILQVHEKPSNTPNQPLIELQSEINYFRNMLTPIKLAEKYNDQNLTTWMMTNTSSIFVNFQHKVNAFRTWIGNTQKHIAAFRNSHLN